MTENKESVQYYEGAPWFWKIFGGAIMGVISILLLAHITNINNNIDRAFLSLRGEIKDLFTAMDIQKERLVTLEQNREQTKEKTGNLQKDLIQLQASLEEIKQKAVANETQLEALKEEIKALKDCNKEVSMQMQEVREKMAAADGAKKANDENQQKK
jgi:hypothetical protein